MAQTKTPLIPGSHCYLKPIASPPVEEWGEYEQHLYGLASLSYQWHWYRADLPVTNGAGYNPYHKEKPHPKQQRFHESNAKLKGFIGGIRSGKSVSGAAETVKLLLEHPGIVGIISGPTYRMIKQATKPTFYKILQPEAIAQRNDSECVLTNGSMVYFRSTEDPNYLRGITAGVIWHDEGSYSVEESFETLIGRLSQPGPYEAHHRYILTTTPRGRNWVWKHFASPGKHPEAEWVQVSVRDNPWIPQATIATYERTFVGWRKKQEVEGEFTLPSGLVYFEFSQDTHVKNLRLTNPELFGEPGSREMWYLHDFGGRNPNVVLAATFDSDDRMYVVDEWYVAETTDDQIAAARSDFAKQYGKGRGIADSEDHKAINYLNKMNLPTEGVKKSPDSLEFGIRLVLARLKVQEDGLPRLFIDQRCVHTINEFGLYQYEENKDGKPVKETPIKRDDHALDALRYGVLTRDRGAAWGLSHAADAFINPNYKPPTNGSTKAPDVHPLDALMRRNRRTWP